MTMTAYAPDKSMEGLRMRVTVIVEGDGDSYHAYCPAFKGLHAAGDNVDEALANAREAACVYVTSLVMHNEPLPLGPDCSLFEEEQVPFVPRGALLRHLELSWPSQNKSGIS